MGGVPDPSIATSLPPEIADPGGVRARLYARGITYGANYIGEVLGVVSGGRERGTTYDGRLELYTKWDLEKLIGWRGLTFYANGYQLHGGSITAEHIGSLAPASSIEATPATRLFELWLEQSLANGKISLRVGQLAADSEFVTSEGASAFVNATFGWPTIYAANMPDGGPAYPLAAPGARLKLELSDQATVLAAVFNGRPSRDCAIDDPQRCNPDGLLFPLGDPALFIAEGQFKYKLGLPGTLKLGGWTHSASFDDTRFDDARGLLAFTGGTPLVHGSNHGLYAIVDQKLYAVPGSDSRGVGVFGRLMTSPADRNLVDLYVEGGVTFTGMWDRRPDDVL
ncbi:MAG: carbohydrate porin, partial [Hyphomicrobiaceae bacterium]